MEKFIHKLRKDHPNLVFRPGHSHCWSPEQGQISYDEGQRPHYIEGVLHELGHARLQHEGYKSDMELLIKEVAAWQEALRLAQVYKVAFDEDHMQDCLDTYRDWIYKRSQCPQCLSAGIQRNESHYYCINCAQTWKVTASRFCRPYRLSMTAETNKHD